MFNFIKALWLIFLKYNLLERMFRNQLVKTIPKQPFWREDGSREGTALIEESCFSIAAALTNSCIDFIIGANFGLYPRK